MAERSPQVTEPPVVRVASVPAAHPYVEHLAGPGVVRLPDPPPAVGAEPGRWWPPAMVDPGWIGENAARFDLMHLHFGTESFPPGHLADVLAALRAAGRPLVYTVHDLVNPQLTDQGPHHAQLDVLVPGADALVTLTRCAAAEVERRWGRAAEVVGHPHILALDVVAPAGRRSAAHVVGLHLRDLRPNVDGPRATRTLLEAVAALRGAGADVEVRVELHDRVRDPAARDAVRRCCGEVAFATLTERPRPSDAELLASLADLDADVLPYGHGTHSGWLELCWDAGVAVAAPEVGCFAAQHRGSPSVAGFAPGAPVALAAALARLLGLEGGRPHPRPGTPERRRLQAARRAGRRGQRTRVAAAHLALYRRVLEAGGS